MKKTCEGCRRVVDYEEMAVITMGIRKTITIERCYDCLSIAANPIDSISLPMPDEE